jgi:hypothetical protein
MGSQRWVCRIRLFQFKGPRLDTNRINTSPKRERADVACDPFAWAGLEGRPYTFTTPEPS